MSQRSQRSRSHAATHFLAAVGAGAILVQGSRVLLNFFGPALPYSMPEQNKFALDSPEFLQFLSLVTDGTLRRSRMTRLRNGAEFYPAILEAIGRAKHAINLEFYEFGRGAIGDRVLAALCERARAGVHVRVIVDALGSFGTPGSYFEPLRAAGGQMQWYHPLRWDTWQNANNRTHRKLLVIDGETGFIGGAGIADRWLTGQPGQPAWRDTMFCVEGEAVAGLISTFCENWLECSGEILSGEEQFRFRALPQGEQSLVVSSTPHGGATQARILFQALIKSARRVIRITTPYFLPDRSARLALAEAVQKRGVRVQILTAGPKIDHPIVRRLSRRPSRHLLRAGAEIYEYQPAMIHAKLMTVDEQWNVVGSTNFDHRSFALNDEVNLAIRDPGLAQVLDRDFAEDLASSRRVCEDMLQERSMLAPEEKLVDRVLELES
ncbi:phosphatidylserine/phosphatidylglycerophosphate/cardiolipin synthase family protein [Acidipila sp. EB88]|uniref:phospholipase D-like domain-containing protein n=1 Tax=Acidipila sp. EB88 TaxID=2305226 RepID=UPI001315959F|nr:phospholipase D-like domain-containing protein [Acidipila sp. EB88]